jgi:hypothetical protein
MDEKQEKVFINYSRHRIDFGRIFRENSKVKYTPGKWKAIRLYTESTMNMIVLMCNYVAQSVMTDMYTTIQLDKKLYKHMVKVYSRDAYESICKSIEKCIVGKRDADQTDYLYVYSDFMDDYMRPRAQEIKRLTEETLQERGCKNPSMCAWVLISEGFVRMSCNIFLSVMQELKEIFKCDLTAENLDYFLDETYENMKNLVLTMQKQFKEMEGLDVMSDDKTKKIFEEIDDEIRNASAMSSASDKADEALTEEHLKLKDKTVQNIMSFVEDDLEDYQRRYAAGEV